MLAPHLFIYLFCRHMGHIIVRDGLTQVSSLFWRHMGHIIVRDGVTQVSSLRINMKCI